MMRLFLSRPNIRPRGFTIIGALVNTFIVGIIVSITGALFVLLIRNYAFYSIRSELVENASTVAHRINTVAVSAFDVEASRTVNSVLYTSGPSTAVFRVASINSSGGAILGLYDYVIFSIDSSDSTRLLEIVDTDPGSSRVATSKVISENLREAIFTYDNGTPVNSSTASFAITVERQARDLPVVYTLQTHARLRNF